MPQSLHPNLAKIAAAYDDIHRRFTLGQLDARRAQTEIAALVARDDEGVLWSIDPATGDWRRRARNGQLVADNPPGFGLATPTAADVSGNGDFNPSSHIAFIEVDDNLLTPPDPLSGATRRNLVSVQASPAPIGRVLRILAVAVAVALVLLAAQALL